MTAPAKPKPALDISPPPLRPYPHALFTKLAAPFIRPAPANSDGSLRLPFDIETNGLDDATEVHCIVVGDADSDQIDEYGPDQIDAALAHLSRADCLIGHNIAAYDLPLLRRLRNWAPASGCRIVDTLIAGRLILPHVADLDKEIMARTGASIGKLHGKFSLEAWGARLGLPKTGADIDDFSKWTPELQERCVGDVAICKTLWRFLQPDGYSQQALELEHRVSPICNQITADGVPFDTKAAERRHQQWTARRAELKAQLSQELPGTNLNSRPQIGALLEARGWVPEKRTKKKKLPKIDDEVLETIPAMYPEFTGLAEYMLLERRLAYLADGDMAWLKHVGEDMRIHGAIIHIGTPHSRAKHLEPNLAQVPNPKRGKPLAAECRALFHHPGDWVFVACDQAGLQDRCFSHYLAEFDGGEYGRSFIAGKDTHWTTATALELVSSEPDKASKLHIAIREGSKSFRYGFLFGMRAKRAGEILSTIIRAARQIDSSYVGPSTDGAQALKRFEAATPGLKQLRQILEAKAARDRWVVGLDGRRVPTGAQYKALNRIVTSAEAIICKRWLISVYDELCARFHYGWAGDAVITAWIHDELVVCCKPEIAEQVGDIMVRHAREPGQFYDLKVPLDAEYKIGCSWAGEPLSSTEANTIDASDSKHFSKAEKPAAPTGMNPSAGIPSDLSIPAFLMRGPAEPTNATKAVRQVTLDDLNEINAGLRREGIEPIDTSWRSVKPAAAVNGCVDRRPHAAILNLHSAPLLADISAGTGAQSGSGYGGSKIRCPFHDDHTPSLEIYPGEDDPHFHCFVCGAHGHLDDLPVDWAATASARHADDAATLAYAHRLWEQAKPIADTLAARYLAEVRGIDIKALSSDIETALRFHPSCPFDGSHHPCLLALFRDIETDEPAGIHRIALTPDARKIDRHMLGRWSQPRAIKLWPLIRLEAAPKPLYLGEGLETVLAAATRLRDRSRPMWPAWAAGTSGNIKKFPVVGDVEELVLLVDRDPEGKAAAAVCRQTWKTAGRRVRQLQTQDPALNDFNDLVRAKLRVVS